MLSKIAIFLSLFLVCVNADKTFQLLNSSRTLTDQESFHHERTRTPRGHGPASTKGPGLVGCTKATLKTYLTNIHQAARTGFTGQTTTITDDENHISVAYHYDTKGRPSYANVVFQKNWRKCDRTHRIASYQSKFKDYFIKSGFTTVNLTGPKNHPQVHVGGRNFIEAGHIVGAQLCGPNSVLNFVPQAKVSNVRAWKVGENSLVRYLRSLEGSECEVEAKMSFTYGTEGPPATHANPYNEDPLIINECLKMMWPETLKIELVSIVQRGEYECPSLPANRVLVYTHHQVRFLAGSSVLQHGNKV